MTAYDDIYQRESNEWLYDNYDVVVLGSGPAVWGAAMNAAKHGRKVALVWKEAGRWLAAKFAQHLGNHFSLQRHWRLFGQARSFTFNTNKIVSARIGRAALGFPSLDVLNKRGKGHGASR